jgi:hypothetical protein
LSASGDLRAEALSADYPETLELNQTTATKKSFHGNDLDQMEEFREEI